MHLHKVAILQMKHNACICTCTSCRQPLYICDIFCTKRHLVIISRLQSTSEVSLAIQRSKFFNSVMKYLLVVQMTFYGTMKKCKQNSILFIQICILSYLTDIHTDLGFLLLNDKP